MEYSGTVHGSAARIHLDFCYRKAVMLDIDQWSVDPKRLNYDSYFPRSVNPPSQPAAKTVDLADYMVKFCERSSDGMWSVQVFMMPNNYTMAKEKRVVFECETINGFVHRERIVDHVLSQVFSQHKAKGEHQC